MQAVLGIMRVCKPKQLVNSTRRGRHDRLALNRPGLFVNVGLGAHQLDHLDVGQYNIWMCRMMVAHAQCDAHVVDAVYGCLHSRDKLVGSALNKLVAWLLHRSLVDGPLKMHQLPGLLEPAVQRRLARCRGASANNDRHSQDFCKKRLNGLHKIFSKNRADQAHHADHASQRCQHW